MAWTNVVTRATNYVVTATNWNEFVNNFKAIGDAWTSYTPSWTASTTNPTIGNGSVVGGWISAGKLTKFRITITVGSTTTVGSGTYSVTLPTAADSTMRYSWFNGSFRDASASATYPLAGELQVSGVNELLLRQWPSTALADPFKGFTNASPVVPASGDVIVFWGEYEAA